MIVRRAPWLGTLLLGLLTTTPAGAEVRLAGAFGDHMVLQRDRPVAVWGWAAPGEPVTVRFAGQERPTTAGPDGAWRVTLGPMALDRQPHDLSVTGPENAITLTDVLVGDVWLCTGQSNMAFGLGAVATPEELAALDLPEVRYRGYFECFAGEPRPDVAFTPWHRVTPATAAGCTAVGLHFARKVQAETGVPIGLLECTVGGTEIECWMPPQAFAASAETAAIAKALDEAVAAWRAGLPAQLDAMERWIAAARPALARGDRVLPAMPAVSPHPNEDRAHWVRTQSLYNGMVHPLTPFAIKGAIWYQGESNSGQDHGYATRQRALIESWRALWGYEFPFYYVQLAAWQQPNPSDPSGGGPDWNFTRMGQLRGLAVPRTGMAVAIDLGDADDIHPRRKREVGERLALWALAKDYGHTDLVFSGPIYRDQAVEGDHIRIRFEPWSIGSGLAIAAPGDRLQQFAIAGADRKWAWAEATIDGDTVVVRSPDVPHPVAVRYAFRMNPEGANLSNRDGLPAAPFRTDEW